MGITLNENNQRFEFEIDIKKVAHKNRWNKAKEIKKEPTILKNLILAHQLQQLRDTGQIKSIKKASQWLNLHHVRIDQIMNLLLLCPKIQEDILSLSMFKLKQIPEYKLRPIAHELDWQKQQELWQELLQS